VEQSTSMLNTSVHSTFCYSLSWHVPASQLQLCCRYLSRCCFISFVILVEVHILYLVMASFNLEFILFDKLSKNMEFIFINYVAFKVYNQGSSKLW